MASSFFTSSTNGPARLVSLKKPNVALEPKSLPTPDLDYCFEVVTPVLLLHLIQLPSSFLSPSGPPLSQWSPDSGSNLLAEMRLPQDILTGNVFPEEYLRLFQLMEQSQEFMQSWLYDEILENTLREGWV